jgi:Arc/MetJ family transcription regulator
MRTNIVLDDELLSQALKLAHVRTKKELIHTALKEYVINHSRKDLREIRGKITFKQGYDYKKLRRG